MRSLLHLAAVLSAATLLTAQSPLFTTLAGGNGQAGNMFDIVATNPAGVTIEYFDVNVDSGTWDFEVYVLTVPGGYLPEVFNAAAWTMAGSATGVVSNGAGVATTLPIAVCEFIPTGATQAFYVTCTNGTGINYTNGVAGTTGTVFASNVDVQFLAGAGMSYPFGSNFNPRIFNGNIYYSVGAGPCNPSFPITATNTPFGEGCGGTPIGDGTFYEVFDAANPVDIANTSYTLTWGGNGYVVNAGATPFYTPTGADLGLGDDVVVTIALPFSMPTPGGMLDEIYLGSNGYIGFQAGLPADFTESVAELLAQQARLAFFWDDLQPNALISGDCTAELDGSGVFHITFTDVPEWGTTNLNTIQVSLNPNGDIEIKYGSIGSTTGIVGFSTGNGATDPGVIDLSTALPLVITTGVFVADLTLFGATRPVIGTNWDLTTIHIDPVSPFAITFFGDRNPTPVALLAFGIDAPGCDANLLAPLFGSLTATNVNGSATVTVVVPNDPALVGALLSAQSLALSLVNPANIVTSNGVEGKVGDV